MNLCSILEYVPENKYLILYFYPKDNTPGCTLEAQDFSGLKSKFSELGVTIVGVSKDSQTSHDKFIEKKNLNITLISDELLKLHKKFGVRGEKKNYGKIYMGVTRSTFLLDSKGSIIKEWRNVKARGHADRVFNYIKDNF